MTNAELEEMAKGFKVSVIGKTIIQLDKIRKKYPLNEYERMAIAEAIECMFEKKQELATWFAENTEQLGELQHDKC